MKTLAVICPLEVAAHDRDWIEGLRARHDPQCNRVEAHFTLVFPMADISLARLHAQVEAIAQRTSAIDFQLKRAIAVRDSFAPRSHVFLIPGQGEAEIRGLHAALYTGEMAPSLRADIPYHPHVTVAAFETHAAAESLARDLGPFHLAGRIRTLAVMSVTAHEITREAVVALL